MLITLNSGKTVDISWEKFDSMSDREYEYFLQGKTGEQINDPFYQSQIHNQRSRPDDDDFDCDDD